MPSQTKQRVKPKIKIVDSFLACPYCIGEVSHERLGCCGEPSAHFETAHITECDDCILESDLDDYEIME